MRRALWREKGALDALKAHSMGGADVIGPRAWVFAQEDGHLTATFAEETLE
jgi:hypothetical protein